MLKEIASGILLYKSYRSGLMRWTSYMSKEIASDKL